MERHIILTCPAGPQCGRLEFSKVKIHLITVHKFTDFHLNSVFQCKEFRCNRDFTKWAEYLRHVKKDHILSIVGPVNNHVVLDGQIEETMQDSGSGNVEIDNHTRKPKPFIDNVKVHMHNVFSCFVGKMYSVPKLPRSFVQDLVSDTISLLHESLCQVKYLTAGEGSLCTNNDAINCFEEILSVFNEFRTEFRRLKIMEKSGNYIEPKPFVVGSEVKQKRKDGRIVSELSPLTGQLVPIKKVLECFFSMPGVFDVVMAYVNLLENETFGIIGNFMQGALWKFKVAKYFVGKLVLPLNFYHDEYEINNPLGSHSGLAKQGGTYFSIPCLPPEHISQLANIFLASLNYALDRKSAVCSTSRNEAIFRHIVLQINDLLRNGIVVKCGGQEHKLYFGFGLLLGDNEGLNSTQDFASATSYCRFCKASPSDIKVDLFEKTELLRCEEDYDEDVSADYKVSGIKLKSVWNEIDGHHIYNNYSVDLLHDIEEGLLKYGMFHVVHHFVNNAQQKVSLEILNDRMRLFNYYDNGITNKPQLISDRDLNTEKRLRRSGSEMHNFTLIFAMLIGDLISTKDEVWQYYLVVRKILSFLYAPQIQTECIDSFSLLVASHHKLYIHLFNDTLKPKFHNLVHYARIMKQSGPLCHLSTIRYEARHKPNKEVAAATTSRRDPLRTVAIKNQLQLCYRLTANQGLRERFHVGPSCAIMPGDKTLLNVLESYGDFVEISWVEINGTKYRPNMFVCHSVDESDGLPQFGQIEKILCNENFEILLHCKNFETLGLEENFSAYEVVVKHGNINVPIKSLIMYSPVVFWKLGLIGDMFMTLRHAL